MTPRLSLSYSEIKNHLKGFALSGLFLLFQFVPLFSQIDSISNIRVSQRTDGSKIVDIYYDLAGPEYYYNIQVQVSLDNGNTFTALDSLAGDHGIGVQPGINKHILWYAEKEMPDQHQTNALIKIILETDYHTCGVSRFYHDGFEYGTVEYQGRCWLNKNLGALYGGAWCPIYGSDTLTFGHAYQWGRLSDGHEYPYSQTTNILSNTDEPGHDMFINNVASDWREPPNDYLWQGIYGINNPCPHGFRVPTSLEWQTAMVNFDDFLNGIGLPFAGTRSGEDYYHPDDTHWMFLSSYYWTSTTYNNGTYAASLHFLFPNIDIASRSWGLPVRCIAGQTDYLHRPVYIHPVSGSVGVSEFTSIKWTHLEITNVVFDVYFGSTSNPPLVLNNTTDTIYNPGILELETKYYWRVVVKYPTGIALPGGLWSFATRDFTCGSSIVEYDGITYNTVSYVDRCWLDRNLGAQTAATSHNDPAAYGDYYQWGRLKDGHQSASSPVISDYANSNSPGHSSFIVSGTFPYDWRSPQNDSLWQGESQVNNPCPQGWEVPSDFVWQNASIFWNTSIDAFISPLKLPSAGFRNGLDGVFQEQGNIGSYWTRTSAGNYATNMFFNTSAVASLSNPRSNGYPVRCIRSLPIDKPIASFPVNDELVQTKHVTLNWSCLNPDGDPLLFDIYFGQDTMPPLLVPNHTDTIYYPGMLEYNTTYYWKIVAKDQFGKERAGALWSFTVDQFNCGTTTILHDGLFYGTVSFAGNCWLDRNLGALQVAQSPNDSLSYGDLYQWGRLKDGHEYPYSEKTYQIATSPVPGHNKFIIHHINDNPDWMSPPQPDRWQGVNGINNPCPEGWVLPSVEIWETVVDSISLDPFNISLKVPFAGYRIGYYGPTNGGEIEERNLYGYLWSSLGYGGAIFGTDGAWTGAPASYTNANGMSVRCIKYEWQCGDQLVDDRDGQSYNTVKIGEQCWMAENLNIGEFNSVYDFQNDNGIIEKHCYADDTSNCTIYGGLYEWGEMMQYQDINGGQGICPTGWHIPTDIEWCQLTKYLDPTVDCYDWAESGTTIGTSLKSDAGWDYGGNGDNSSAFSALPAGHIYADYGGGFIGAGSEAYYWTSSAHGSATPVYRSLFYNSSKIKRWPWDVPHSLSVRCIKDQPSSGWKCGDPLIDARDDQSYRTVQIDDQCWMAENLKATTYLNNTSIEYPGNNDLAWINNTSGAYAWSNDDPSWKDAYGALYNWHAVNNSNGLCPAGWHIPTDNEWTALTGLLGGDDAPNGDKLKSCRQVNSNWQWACETTQHPRWDANNNHNGTDNVGFSGLPGGGRDFDAIYGGLGANGLWWTSTEDIDYPDSAWARFLDVNEGNVIILGIYKEVGFSVRCVKDEID